MNAVQIAAAVYNDRTTEPARLAALAAFAAGADWDAAVHTLLPTIITEVKKPIYEGMLVSGLIWSAAAETLEMQLEHSIACKGA